jgi:uncharacterized NAD(P)/FAD-binding protein YdhS
MMIGIIGAGYSGAALAFNIHRLAQEPTQVLLFERRDEHGLGAAYSTTNPEHLLNVPAGGMSGLADEPDDFVNFLRRDQRAAAYIRGDQNIRNQFVPRMVYGWYIQSLLAQSQSPSAHGSVVETIGDEVTGVRNTEQGLLLHTQRGRVVRVDKLVLATGHAPPARGLLAEVPARHLVADPWNYARIEGIDRNASVLIVGTGLTMVDTVMTLAKLEHRGEIVALSRRGLAPQSHGSLESDDPAEWQAQRLRALRRKLCRRGRNRVESGGDWREVVNALRGKTQELWRGLNQREQNAFLRHLAPYWESHRHRIAPEVAGRIQTMIQAGQLRIMAGKIVNIATDGQVAAPVHISVRPRGSGRNTVILRADAVVNCTGPETNIARSTDPLLQSMLRDGLIRPDAHRLGLDVADDGGLINAVGEVSEKLFTLGPTTRGRWYEIVAVPDIRRQSHALAQRLLVPSARPCRLAAVA